MPDITRETIIHTRGFPERAGFGEAAYEFGPGTGLGSLGSFMTGPPTNRVLVLPDSHNLPNTTKLHILQDKSCK